MIFEEIETQVVDHLNDTFKGKAEAQDIHSNNTQTIAFWMRDNLRSISSYPHALVYCGTSQEQQRDASNQLPRDTFDVEVFVATRNSSHENESEQKRLSDDWTMVVRAALSGLQLGSEVTNTNLIDQVTVDRIFNNEEAALAVVTGTLDLVIDHDLILEEI